MIKFRTFLYEKYLNLIIADFIPNFADYL